MTAPSDARFALLALVIAAGALLALWYLLRRERPGTWLALAALSAAGLALRLLHTADYPAGLNEDEPKLLAAALRALHEGAFLAESNTSVPVLMHALFNGQLVAWLGPGRWAIRLYSLVGGVLCIPAAFAAARALGTSVGAALGSAALIAALPWALFYSRVMQGAELTFQQLLLIAALAHLLPMARADGDGARAARGGASAPLLALIASFALAWLAYGHWCTRAMFALPLIAALLARGRNRLWCLLPLVAGLAAYAPYVLANRDSMFVAQGVDPAQWGDGGGLAGRAVESLHALLAPVAADGWLTLRAAAMHPPLLLLVALAGALTGWRRALFLGAGFAAGLAPSVLAWGAPSTHRMLMAFPFIALAVACACDLVPRRRLRALVIVAVALASGAWSARLYFSDDFWTPEARAMFDWQRTALVESLPFDPHPPVYFLRQVRQFREPRSWVAPDDRLLTLDAWLPAASGGLYAFSAPAAPLRPLYERLLGAERVTSFGDAFTVRVEPGDWSWLRAHGWMYQLRCGDVGRRAQVPALHQMTMGFAELDCDAPATHTWVGRWVGPPTRLRLRAGSALVVKTPRETLDTLGDEQSGPPFELEIEARPGDQLRIQTTTPAHLPWSDLAVWERAQAGERLPAWESVVPP